MLMQSIWNLSTLLQILVFKWNEKCYFFPRWKKYFDKRTLNFFVGNLILNFKKKMNFIITRHILAQENIDGCSNQSFRTNFSPFFFFYQFWQPSNWQPSLWQPSNWQPGNWQPSLWQPSNWQPSNWQPSNWQPSRQVPAPNRSTIQLNYTIDWFKPVVFNRASSLTILGTPK